MERFILKFQMELLVLHRLYVEANGAGEDISAYGISNFFDPPLPVRRVSLALEELYNRDLAVLSDLEYYSISNKGISQIESQFSEGDSFLSNYVRYGQSYLNEEFVPASDRLVSIGDNNPDAEAIGESLAEVRENVRGINDPSVEEPERRRVLGALDAAIALWEAGHFRLIQLKVGVLLAAEEAQELLAKTAKSVGAGLLIEAIKAFAKNHLKIDLDQI